MLLPLASFNASGSDDLIRTQEATGNNEASLSGSSKTNLMNCWYHDIVDEVLVTYLAVLWL